MALALPCLALILLCCWAPELAPQDPPIEGPGRLTPPEALGDLPPPPFAARTNSAPLTLVGPGGVTIAQLAEAELSVEVLQVLEHRVRIRCTGCPGPARDTEGWLQREAIRPAPGSGG